MVVDTDYSTLVAKADAAAASVKDPGLRAIAFEKILSTLLAQKHRDLRLSTSKKQSRETSTTPPRSRAVRRKSRTGPKAYIEQLIDEDFFGTPRTIATVKAELANRGHHVALTSLSGPLQALTQERRLRRQKAKVDGSATTKGTFAYSNW
jgi:hypothetical protein